MGYYALPPDEAPDLTVTIPTSAQDILRRRYDDDEVNDILERTKRQAAPEIDGARWLYYFNISDGMDPDEAYKRKCDYEYFTRSDKSTDGLRYDATSIESDGQLRLL